MILMVSGRTDIVGFYTKWFMNRVKDGYFLVRNPFRYHEVSRINYSDVDLIMFCTKNPLPIIPYLKDLKKPILFHVTLTSYKKDIEPNVIDKKEIIKGVKKISEIIGIDNIYVRYDPIFLSDKYDINYHLKAFEKLCKELNGYVKHIVISFMDLYKNVYKNNNILRVKGFKESDYKVLCTGLSEIASKYNMIIQSCFEDDYSEYGIKYLPCLSSSFAYKLTGKKYRSWNARKCGCVSMADIGEYNTCKHLCKYCYANFSEDKIKDNISKHDDTSPFLIGNIESEDVIKVRK